MCILLRVLTGARLGVACLKSQHLGDRHVDICEFKVSLLYIVRDLVFKQTNQQQ